MPGATQAITLLLIGTGICAYGYESSQRGTAYDGDDATASTQPSSGYHTYYGGSHHWYNSFYHSGGSTSSSSFGSSSSHSSSTARGGFGSTAHAHASASS